MVDLSRHLPGPLAGKLLADLGARVVKVEEPSLGDPSRGAPPRRGGTSALSAVLLSGVESLALDLKNPGSRPVLARLLARADVLLDSFRPGALARLGFPPGEIAVLHPRLVHCSVTGWGESGPYAARAGHDLTYQALAGTLASTAAMPAVPLADLIGAWSAVTSILAALLERERTGKGRRIDAALYDAAVHANLTGWVAEAGTPARVGRPLPLSGALPCYNLYQTADGYHLALAALEPHFWERFCRAAGREDLRRKQYSSSAKVRRKVAALISSRTRAEWIELFAREDIPAEPVLSAAAARAHPQAEERGLLADGPDGLPRLAFPARLDGERPRGREQVPGVGEQTESLLAELGFPARSRRDWQREGVGRRFSWRSWMLRLAAAATWR